VTATSKFTVVAPPRSTRGIDTRGLLMAVFMVALFVTAIAGLEVAATTGHTTAGLVVALVAGGSFSTAFC
jgi:hypothetical protein